MSEPKLNSVENQEGLNLDDIFSKDAELGLTDSFESGFSDLDQSLESDEDEDVEILKELGLG